MAEDPSELREAIRETRSNMAETIDALGQKVDVKAKGVKKANDVRKQAKARLRRSATVSNKRSRAGSPRGSRGRRSGKVDDVHGRWHRP